MDKVSKDGYLLRFIENQTEEMCLCAVRQNGNALQYVKNQTEEMCLCAVRQNGYLLQYVHNQTPTVCMEAVLESAYSLQYVHHQTDAICIKAITAFPCAIRYVCQQTDAMHILVLSQPHVRSCSFLFQEVFRCIKSPSPATINIALKLFPSARYIIMEHDNTQKMMDHYKTQHKLINSDIILYTNDFLYRPHNIGCLLCINYNTAKTFFLTD